MMEIEIIKSTKLSKKEVRSMTKFMFKILLTKKERKKLKLTISFDPIDSEPRLEGYCIQGADDYKYLIWCRGSRQRESQRQTLAHEFVHVRQMIQKDMSPFTGKLISKRLDGLSIKNGDQYWDSPTEIEADGRARGLVSRWHTKHNKTL